MTEFTDDEVTVREIPGDLYQIFSISCLTEFVSRSVHVTLNIV